MVATFVATALQPVGGGQAVADPTAVQPLSPRPAAPIVLSTSDQTVEYFSFNSHVIKHYSRRLSTGHSNYRQLPYLSEMTMSNTVAIEAHDGAMHVFTVRSSDGAVWTSKQMSKGGSWSGWVSLGGSGLANAAPAVTRGAGEALSVFATATDRTVRSISQQSKDGPWGSWSSLGGSDFFGGLSVGRGPNDRLEVVAVSLGGTVFKNRQGVGGFSGWEQFSDARFVFDYVAPQVITRSDRSLEVVVRTSGSAIATRRQNAPGGTWGAWTIVGGHAGLGRPAVVLGPDGVLTILSADSQGKVSVGRFGFDPTTGAAGTVPGWEDLAARGAPLAGRKDLSGAGLVDGSWVATYNDTTDEFSEITSADEDAPDGRATPEPPKLRPLNEVRAEDGRPGHLAEGVTPVSRPTAAGWTPPAFQYEHYTFDQCRTREWFFQERGTVKNHYSYCWSGVNAIHFKTFCFTLPLTGVPVCVGRRLDFFVTMIGDGSDAYREARYDVYLTGFEGALEYADAVQLKVEMQCTPLVAATDCAPDPRTPPVVRTVSEWMSAGEVRLHVVGGEPEPDPLLNPDRIGYGLASVKVTAALPLGHTEDVVSPRNKIRFDSAQYLTVNGKQGAIFPEVDAVLNFPVNTPEFAAMRQSGAHYEQAMTQPGSTFPVVAGKTIPGALGSGKPLHRLYFDDDRRRDNRTEAVRACENELPPGQYPQPDYDCDEYPFASTYEGASSTYNPQRNFSVKVIPADDNRAAGVWLGVWYSYDRILDGDAFYVRVIQ